MLVSSETEESFKKRISNLLEPETKHFSNISLTERMEIYEEGEELEQLLPQLKTIQEQRWFLMLNYPQLRKS